MIPLSVQLEEAGLSRVATRLLALAQFGARLERIPITEDEVPPRVSRLGGLPEAPATTVWPRRRGAPLAFVAQVDLAELADLPGLSLLPRSGLLSFFYDSRAQPRGFDPHDADAARVFLFDTESPELEPLSPPEDAQEVNRFPVCLLVARPTLTLPPVQSRSVMALELNGPELNGYYDVLESQAPHPSHGRLHQLMGHPAVFHGDLALCCQLAAHGLPCEPSSTYDQPQTRELASGASAWRLLLQLDSDEHADMQWGDGGRLYFWIRETDLAERRFDRAWTVLQSS